jgi:hypothetical protein
MAETSAVGTDVERHSATASTNFGDRRRPTDRSSADALDVE